MDAYALETFSTPSTALDRLQELIGSAERQLMVSAPARVVDAVCDELRAARERGVLVLLLVGGSPSAVDGLPDTGPGGSLQADPGVGSVVRCWDGARDISVICTADDDAGLCAVGRVYDRKLDAEAGVVFSHPLLRTHVFSTVVGNTWNRAREAFVADPDDLPATYETFPKAVVNAYLHLRRGRDLAATVRGHRIGTGTETTVEGCVCNVRQSFVAPATSSFPVENSLFLRDEGEQVTVGGPGAFVEDVEAVETTLRRS